MKLRIWSDIHVEFGPFTYTPLPADGETTLVIAGDHGVGPKVVNDLSRLCEQFQHVVYVCGNHEYYGSTIYETNLHFRMLDKATSNFHFLNGTDVVLDDVLFVGGTLWSDFRNGDPLTMAAARSSIRDFARIQLGGGDDFTPEVARDINAIQRGYIQRALVNSVRPKKVVVSHFPPSMSFCKMRDCPSPLDFYFHNTGLDLMLNYGSGPDLWIFGHTHSSVDTVVGDGITRAFSNPRGYVGHELNPNFNELLTIEI